MSEPTIPPPSADEIAIAKHDVWVLRRCHDAEAALEVVTKQRDELLAAGKSALKVAKAHMPSGPPHCGCDVCRFGELIASIEAKS